jgi:hypothetical protein
MNTYFLLPYAFFTAEFHRVHAEFRRVLSFKEFATYGGRRSCSRKILLKIKPMIMRIDKGLVPMLQQMRPLWPLHTAGVPKKTPRNSACTL